VGKKCRKKRKIRRGICPKCFNVKALERHHVWPLRFYKANGCILHLCQECHWEIEKLLPQRIQLSKEQYLKIHEQWLKGEELDLSKK